MAALLNYRNRSIRRRNTQLIHGFMILWAMICLCLAFFAGNLLPEKYLFDAANIASRFGYVNGFSIGQSYDNTALFYQLLLLSESQSLAGLVFSVIFVIFVFKCVIAPRRINFGALHNLLLFSFTCVVGAVYLGQYSKESTSVLLVIIFMAISGTASGRLIWVVLACAYAVFFRPYWVIVVALYLFFRFFLNRIRSPFIFLWILIFVFLLLSLAFKLILGVDLAYYRYMVNDTRIYDVAANTMINPLFSGGGVGLEWCNGVAQFFMMFFPIPLLSGNPLYLIFFVIMASLGVRLVIMLKKLTDCPRKLRLTKSTESIGLLIAFITVQSIFEPDYGSYIRHLMPMLPVALFVTCRSTISYGSSREKRRSMGSLENDTYGTSS